MKAPDFKPRGECRRPFLGALSRRTKGFTLTELLVILAVASVLAAIVIPVLVRSRAKSKLTVCLSNLQKVNHAVLLFAEDNKDFLPSVDTSPAPGGWWWYKEQVKSFAGLTGASSVQDKVFACPNDRGYGEEAKIQPFCRSQKHDYTSYVFNGVNLPGMPNIAGRTVGSIKDPAKTLLVMEWTAHAPLSWHKSRTGKKNSPFYNDAESVVGFVDGHVGLVKFYFDGTNPAYTMDPIPGYDYRYSGD